jgi:hypothetical protein
MQKYLQYVSNGTLTIFSIWALESKTSLVCQDRDAKHHQHVSIGTIVQNHPWLSLKILH